MIQKTAVKSLNKLYVKAYFQEANKINKIYHKGQVGRFDMITK